MKIAVLCLLGVTSAVQRKHHHKTKTYQKFHVDDSGFVVLGEKTFIRKESDWLANGDAKDDLEVQNEFDPEDPVVMDNGFGLSAGNWAENAWTANQYKGSLNDFVQINSNLVTKIRKESDWLANGDEKDDLEVQNEFDKEDPVVMDNGFGLSAGNWAENAWTANHYKGSLNDFIQLDSKMESGDLFLTEGFKEEHPRRIMNALAQPLDKAVDTMYAQMGEMEQDHFFTQTYTEDHPHKLKNAFYERGSAEDVENMQLEYNEIDNYNPRAQARLAKYAEYM